MGYKMAGFQVVLATDFNEACQRTYTTNFPGTDFILGDIHDLSVDAVLERTGLKPGELDVLDGSPPCQGFSLSGKREMEDPRNSLWREYLRLLKGLKPRVAIMENVTGLTVGRMRDVLEEMLREYKAAGYRLVWGVLQAWRYGVPQGRRRLYVIMAREDLGKDPTLPPATRFKPIDAAEACQGVPVDEKERAELLAAGLKYEGYKGHERIGAGRALSDIKGGNSYFNAVKAHPFKPAPTLTKFQAQAAVGSIMHWRERRRFTSAELKRLSSFPDDFVFPGGWKDCAGQIGNSVPPKLSEAVARHVSRTILGGGGG